MKDRGISRFFLEHTLEKGGHAAGRSKYPSIKAKGSCSVMHVPRIRSLMVVRLSVQCGVVFKELHEVSGLLCFAIDKDGRTALTKDPSARTLQTQENPLSTIR